jgi:hypothetical protein
VHRIISAPRQCVGGDDASHLFGKFEAAARAAPSDDGDLEMKEAAN